MPMQYRDLSHRTFADDATMGRRGMVLGITSLAFVDGGSGLGFAVDARKLCPLLAGMTGCE